MGSGTPTVHSLEKPENLQQLLKRDRGDDCLSCKIVGSGTLLGLAGYSYYTGISQIEKNRNAILQSKSLFGIRSRKMGIVGTSLVFAGMGLWRAFK